MTEEDPWSGGVRGERGPGPHPKGIKNECYEKGVKECGTWDQSIGGKCDRDYCPLPDDYPPWRGVYPCPEHRDRGMSLMLGRDGARLWTVVNTSIVVEMKGPGDWDAYIPADGGKFTIAAGEMTKADALKKVESYIGRKLKP